jgi:3-hydroxyisobutyrate dehydrogenase
VTKDAGLDSPDSTPLHDSYFSAQQEGPGEQDVMAIISSPEKFSGC